jgi:flagellar motor switch protein FliN/FliY
MSEGITANMPEALEYLQVWAECCAQVLTQIAGVPMPIECLREPPASMLEASDTDIHFIVTPAGTLRGEMHLRMPQSTVLCLAQLLLAEAVDAKAEFKSDHREAAEEALRQIAGQAATALKARWGEVQLSVRSDSPPSWAATVTVWIQSTAEATHPLIFECGISAALAASLQPSCSFEPAAGQPSAGISDGAQLDVFMDMELDLTLRFGGRNMLLREILELSSGSVIELDRQVDEAAELLLNGRVIARGQVVMVDGNYGLRITEVIARAAAA